MKKRNFLLLFTFLMTLFLVACGNEPQDSSTIADKKDITIGFNPGPYEDIFRLGVEPILTEKGYTITYKNFTDGVVNNAAVASGEIDANIFQHSIYLESINEQQGFSLKPAVLVPTPPMGLYSNVYTNLDEVPDGVEVAMPADPVNMARGLNLLSELGWIKVKEDVNPIHVSDSDIVDNPKNVKITPMDSAMGTRALEDVALVAIQGNFAIAGGLTLTDALLLETMTAPHTNIVAVKEGNLEAQYVKDIIEAYHAEAFQQVFLEQEIYAGYTLPDYFK
ncbi:MAG: MetQ/NlpA family ABC transporter substrate-binding protein [Solibacillus sp.]